jgi:hypothetical protein
VSLQRFWAAFGIHAAILAAILGDPLDSSPASVWRSLRQRWGTATDILIALHAHHTSLTNSYLSIKPWWLGGLARSWRVNFMARAP